MAALESKVRELTAGIGRGDAFDTRIAEILQRANRPAPASDPRSEVHNDRDANGEVAGLLF